MSEAIVFTSGKGGVGKTTTMANIGTGLSQLDKKVIMIDTDMGLRNLDVVMGLETKIQYNLIDLLENKCRLNQAVIRDKRFGNLFMIPAALNSPDLLMYKKEFLILINTLKEEFDYCLIDCPAGIDFGFDFAVSAADRAIIVTTPGVTSIKDAARAINLLQHNNVKAIDLLINEYDSRLVRKGLMLSKQDIEEILGLKAIGVIPKDNKIQISQNEGIPVITYRTKSARRFLEISANSF